MVNVGGALGCGLVVEHKKHQLTIRSLRKRLGCEGAVAVDSRTEGNRLRPLLVLLSYPKGPLAFRQRSGPKGLWAYIVTSYDMPSGQGTQVWLAVASGLAGCSVHVA